MRGALCGLMLWLALPQPVAAQEAETLADIRQELSVLYVEVQRLRRELSTTGTPGGVAGGSTLERVDAIEVALRGLTAKTEELEFRIDRIVRDGTNRIGDLEFRLVELEGGDVSQLGETTTLGGGSLPPRQPVAPPAAGGGGGSELALAEQADFEAAQAALAAGDYVRAAELYETFAQTYPASPIAARVALGKGRALDGQGDTREAARAYLAAFTSAPEGPVAPGALLALGDALGRLGQLSEACVMLDEVGNRFPGAAEVSDAQTRRAALDCS